jgi:mono/diheme cytochrome c family protein
MSEPIAPSIAASHRRGLFSIRAVSSAVYGAAAIALVVCGAFMISASAAAAPLQCPQPRFTGKAPQEFLDRKNPFSAEKADTKQMEKLYRGEANAAVNCAVCHGVKGDGRGPLSDQYMPPPRNFACAMTIAGVPDGQLFWIIKNGSPETAMPPHPRMSDDEIWQMVLYLRKLSN